jgi:hypothetical protein
MSRGSRLPGLPKRPSPYQSRLFVALALANSVSFAEVAALARHANAKVTAAVYAGIAQNGREVAAAKLVDAGFGR